MAQAQARRAEDAVTEWIGQLRIRGIFLGGISVSINRDTAPRREDKGFAANTNAGIEVQESDEYIKAIASFVVEGRRSKTRKAYFRVRGTYDVLFEKPKTPMTAREATEVAKITTMVIWPYIRELVSSIATRAGMAIPLPPLVKVGDLKAVEE